MKKVKKGMNEKIYRVIEILPMQEGVSQRGAWKSQQIVVEEKVALPHPDRFLLRFGTEQVALLADIKVGDEIRAMWTNAVRFFEKDGKKFYSQECNVWTMEVIVASPSALSHREGTAPLTPTGGVDSQVNDMAF
jgi:hypothetical protein